MRRFRLALALPLLGFLLVAQQGAMLHELSHLYYGGHPLASQVRDDTALSDNSHCLACQSFAQVAHPVASNTAHPIAAAVPALVSAAPAYSVIAAAAPAPRSRGPPQA